MSAINRERKVLRKKLYKCVFSFRSIHALQNHRNGYEKSFRFILQSKFSENIVGGKKNRKKPLRKT